MASNGGGQWEARGGSLGQSCNECTPLAKRILPHYLYIGAFYRTPGRPGCRIRGLLCASARVRLAVDLSQVGPVHMRVDLRGRYARVPQDLLQHAQVGASGEHVRGK